MNEQLLLVELETSANDILSGNLERRKAAENIFLNFQKTSSPFQLCKFILENSENDYVLFQTASLLKKAVIREWMVLTPEDRTTIQSYLLHFVTNHPKAAPYVREQMLLVLAILVKRASLNSLNEEKSKITEAVLGQVCSLIVSGNPHMQTIGCSFILALISEFSTTTQTTDVGLPYEVHCNAKRYFELKDLKKIFQFCLQGLDELNKLGENLSKETCYIMKKFLMIAEQILSWHFQFPSFSLPRLMVGIFESQQYPPFRPPADWRPLMMDPQVVALIFRLHSQVRLIPELAHHTLQCLHQLASLSGDVLAIKEDRLAYLHRFLIALRNAAADVEKLSREEMLGLCKTVNRLGMCFPASLLVSLPEQDIQGFVEWLCQMTCHAAQLSSQEELSQMGRDEQAYFEALDHILCTWNFMLQDNSPLPSQSLKGCATSIFTAYVKVHLAPPDGIRPVTQMDEEVDELEEDDRNRYKDQLLVIGELTRLILDYAVPILSRLMESRTNQLQALLEHLRSQPPQAGGEDMMRLQQLQEDLHWLVLVITHTLVPVGDLKMIPREVIHYCQSHRESSVSQVSLTLLSSLDQPPESVQGYDTHADPVIRLVTSVFRLCEVERLALQAGMAHLLSPEVATTLAYFLRGWIPAYLMPTETYYSMLSSSLTEAFGQDSPSASWVLKWAVGKLESNLIFWFSEPKLCCETALALRALLSAERAELALREGYIARLLSQVHTAQFQRLPSQAKRHLLRGMVGNVGPKGNHWDELVGPFHNAFFSLTGQTDCQQQQQLCDLLECFGGMAEGCTLPSLPRIFAALMPVVERLPLLLNTYHNYTHIVALIFRFFSTFVERTLCYLNAEEADKVYDCCLKMLDAYSHHKKGQVSVEVTAEEDQYEDILVLMQMLTDLLSKDILDMMVSEDSAGRHVTKTSGDLAVYGLSVLLPLMSEGLLRFPHLCCTYFKLVTFMSEVCPAKLVTLSQLPALLESVHLALTQFGSEVVSLCLDFLTVMATYLHRQDPKPEVHIHFKPFLKLVLELVLYQPHERDLVHYASSAVYALICCFPEVYKQLVQDILAANPRHSERLMDGFNRISNYLECSSYIIRRLNHNKFKEVFESFVLEARGFLCMV